MEIEGIWESETAFNNHERKTQFVLRDQLVTFSRRGGKPSSWISISTRLFFVTFCKSNTTAFFMVAAAAPARDEYWNGQRKVESRWDLSISFTLCEMNGRESNFSGSNIPVEVVPATLIQSIKTSTSTLCHWFVVTYPHSI